MLKNTIISLLSFFIFLSFINYKIAHCITIRPGQTAEYTLSDLSNPPAQNVVKITITIGDTAHCNGFSYQWIYLKGLKQNGETYAVWALVDNYPGDSSTQKSIYTVRYIFHEGSEPPREYVHAVTGEALLPELRKWDILFPTAIGESDSPFTEKVHYLGHDFKRTNVAQGNPVIVPPTERIALQPDVSIGTGRNFRDTEGRRILNNQEFPYVDYSQTDLNELIDAGWNHFWVTEKQYEWIKNKHVFSVHPNSGDRFPEMLYRSNMLGGHAYFDEPGIYANRKMKKENTLLDAAQMTMDFTRESDRTSALHNSLASRPDINLGDLNLRHPIPAWETITSTGWFSMKAGAVGIIQECRYILHEWIPYINAHYGCEVPPYPEYLLRYNFAILRGAARHFNCNWGVAVYGEIEPWLSPQTFTLAYDMGARYFWFWTSDHYAHVPYPEQVNLARLLKTHAERNPQRDMKSLLHAAKAAIALPYGYTFEYRGLMYWQREHNLETVNEYGVTYRQVMHNAAVEMERLLRLGIDFDIVQNGDNFTGEGYDEVIYVKPNATLAIAKNGIEEIRDTPRTPPRPSLQAKPEIRVSFVQTGNRVELHAYPFGGSPPLGFVVGIDKKTNLHRKTEVIWEHYPPSGRYRMLYGADQNIELTESGTHKFRAITADAYAAIADKWLIINQ